MKPWAEGAGDAVKEHSLGGDAAATASLGRVHGRRTRRRVVQSPNGWLGLGIVEFGELEGRK